MTATTQSSPRFTVRSRASSARAVFIAALCAFIVTAFVVDVQRGAGGSGDSAAAELRT